MDNSDFSFTGSFFYYVQEIGQDEIPLFTTRAITVFGLVDEQFTSSKHDAILQFQRAICRRVEHVTALSGM